VVGSNLPEMRKIILEGGIGAVFEPADPLKIAQAINELVADENKLERAKHNARHLAETRFNLEIEGRKLLRCYASTFGPVCSEETKRGVAERALRSVPRA